MISAISTKTTKTPVYAPALKMPATRSQPDKRVMIKKDTTKDKLFIGLKIKK